VCVCVCVCMCVCVYVCVCMCVCVCVCVYCVCKGGVKGELCCKRLHDNTEVFNARLTTARSPITNAITTYETRAKSMYVCVCVCV